ncbi:MAG: hypothetical protein R2848_07920 [Thermomicrobiales bacterium]
MSDASDPGSAATVLEVLPIREPGRAPAEALSSQSYLPYLLIALVMLAGLIFALWYFFA